MTELAWAAGVFVGEGCITTSVARRPNGATYEYLTAIVGMYDERAVHRFVAAVPETRFTVIWLPRRGHWFYRAAAKGRSAERALARLWPYIKNTDKGDQAIAKAARLGLAEWITGERTGIRPREVKRCA